MPGEKQTAVKYYIGVDVGSASVRAALVDAFGTVVAHAEQPIQVWEPQPDHYEQSSADIWAACCSVTKVGKDKIKDLCCKFCTFTILQSPCLSLPLGSVHAV